MRDFDPIVVSDPCLRRGRPSVDDLTMHLRLLALLPYAVHVDREAERRERIRADARARARALAAIPSPRAPIPLAALPRVRRAAR